MLQKLAKVSKNFCKH